MVEKLIQSAPPTLEQNEVGKSLIAASQPTIEVFEPGVGVFDNISMVPLNLNRIQRIDRGEPWFDFYPVEEKLTRNADNEKPLLVDIGGSIGTDIAAFHVRFSTLKGSLILEDLPEVNTSITQLKHDFFLPQPEIAKGVKTYLLSTILHDWPDKEAKDILTNFRDAMSEDSILLINENALPNINVPFYPAELDFPMMCLLSGTDRTIMQSV
ncbi:S-adenosyl-L-methionine-dependent methyltransferase [Glarea lozoyensis ATCC 20868]|uniref:S-adenosyl-L-methionine-dependent methyltransferase n=1 Tax=Glarea lozoyensis (strain ATCC 20868 / MF5171) TaxID=1116229 RepID=S3DI71_GLAL2|nr:S-adenosyl-L-methionine-dependent methyltransferase [Glarea lozoyensis ATCC 20868]EPE31726.1 S-adenosyl-L-methionine-dependent methyltransferase [Glarea lozoyensis ATCC 20868]